MDTSIAKDANDKLIRAKQGINKSLPFYCPGCNKEVYAATEGKVQKPHFRHKSFENQKGCSEPESYIHWVTKELFAENYKQVDSFYLSINILKTCIHEKYNSCKKNEIVKINLKKIYPYIKVEKETENFRPDCLLFNDQGEKLFFEVCYSSKVSENKINSGFPIIELHTTNEKTIDTIIEKRELKCIDEINFHSKKYSQLPLTKIYNKKQLLLHVNTSFNCFEKCIIDKQKRNQNQKEYSLSKNISLPKDIYLPKEISNQPREVDRDAILYLSHYKKGYYAQEKAIPSVLKKCREYYAKQYSKYKTQSVSSQNPIILDEDENKIRLFVYYQENFLGIVRYEFYWHIFYNKDDKIIFISSKKTKNDILNEIKIHMDIF